MTASAVDPRVEPLAREMMRRILESTVDGKKSIGPGSDSVAAAFKDPAMPTGAREAFISVMVDDKWPFAVDRAVEILDVMDAVFSAPKPSASAVEAGERFAERFGDRSPPPFESDD